MNIRQMRETLIEGGRGRSLIHMPGWPFCADTLTQESKLALLRHVNMLSGFMTSGQGTSPPEIVLTQCHDT